MSKAREYYGAAIYHIAEALGDGALHESVPQFKEHFPNASEVQLWGASIVYDFKANTMTLHCAGESKTLPM